MRLLCVHSSARESSVTRRLTANFVDRCREKIPSLVVVERDLARTEFPHITDQWLATMLDPAQWTSGQRQYLRLSDDLISEIFGADVIAVGAPMHNFTITWELKAWIDQVVRLGKTLSYGAKGPVGFVRGKKVVVIASRGGSRSNREREGTDYHESYLRSMFAFIGLTDVTFVHAENQYRQELAEAGFQSALEQIQPVVNQIADTHQTRQRELAAQAVTNLIGGEMSKLQAVDPGTATGKAKDLLALVEQRLHRVPNMIRLMANSPAILEGYLGMTDAFQKSKISSQLRGLVTAALAELTRCDYMLSFAAVMAKRDGLSEAELAAARRGESSDPKTSAALQFAVRAALEHGHLPENDLEKIQRAGFSDEEIVELIAFIGLTLFRINFNLLAGAVNDFPAVAPLSAPAATHVS